MRIFFAVATYWPFQDGVANITGYLAEGLSARGHKVSVLTGMGRGEALSRREIHNDVSIERMQVYVQWPMKLKGLDRESSPQKYFQKIQDFQPDILIVVCSQIWTFDWLMPYLDKISCPKVFYSHGYSKWKERYDYREKLRHRNIPGIIEEYKCKRYYDRLYKYVARYDKAIYLSKDSNSVKYAEIHHLNNGVIIENAIEDIFFEASMRHQYGGKEKKEVSYLYVANYNENKNQEMLIRAYGKACVGRSRLIFAGYGETPYLGHLKELAGMVTEQAPEKAIDFYVHIPRAEVIGLYRKADVFVCTSKSETWSIVAHEAAALAMPIISTDVGIYSEIDGAVIIHDEAELVNALEELYYAPDRRQSCGEDARRWILKRQCRIQDKVDQLEEELMLCLKTWKA